MNTDISSLDPRMIPLAQAFIAALAAKGVPHVVTSTRRSDAEQKALYAQGRQPLSVVNAMRHDAGLPSIGPSDNSYTVTNADGVRHKSMHQLGLAMDVVPLAGDSPVWPGAEDTRWLQLAEAGEGVGLEWGGRWTIAKDGIDPDRPHYQYRG